MGRRKNKVVVKKNKKAKMPTQFDCFFCDHEQTVYSKIDKKSSTAILRCRVCGEQYTTTIHNLTRPIDVYHEWLDENEKNMREEDERARQEQEIERRRYEKKFDDETYDTPEESKIKESPEDEDDEFAISEIDDEPKKEESNISSFRRTGKDSQEETIKKEPVKPKREFTDDELFDGDLI